MQYGIIRLPLYNAQLTQVLCLRLDGGLHLDNGSVTARCSTDDCYILHLCFTLCVTKAICKPSEWTLYCRRFITMAVSIILRRLILSYVDLLEVKMVMEVIEMYLYICIGVR